MPLQLVTGPANAAKARTILEAARACAAASPLLVVPTTADVEIYRRELAADGAVLGVRVERFDGLLRELAFRGGVAGRTLTELQRERVAAAAIAATPLERLAGAAQTPGFAPALVAFVQELGEARVEPPRFVRALRDWAAGEPSRAGFAEELGALVLAYRRVQERTGRRDRPQHVTAALDALREDPRRWGATPVFLYGFDDLSPLQRDVVDTLANAVGAEVMLSLTFEAGRTAFAARATLHQELLALGATEEVQPAVSDYYAPSARAVLHHVERALYEPEAPRADPGTAVLALEGGGERAEVEIVAAEVARLIREEGMAPEEIAVVHRGLDSVAPLIDLVFRTYDIPAAVRRTIKVGHTALGRGLVAMVRCALLDASADELLSLAAHARRATDARVRRPAGVPGAPRGCVAPPRRRERSGSRSAGRWRRSTTWRRPTRAAASRRWPSASTPRRPRCLPRLGGGRRRSSTPRASLTRASPPRCAVRCASWRSCRPSCSPSPPRWSRRSTDWRSSSAHSRAPGASRSPSRSRCAPGAYARCSALAFRKASFPRRPSPSRFSATRSAVRSTRRRACGCASTKTRCTSSACSSTPRSHARPSCWRSAGTQRVTMARPRSGRCWSMTSPTSSPTAGPSTRAVASLALPAGRAGRGRSRRPSARPRASRPLPRRPPSPPTSATCARPPRWARCASATPGRRRSWRSGPPAR